jgi:hypothetical protein
LLAAHGCCCRALKARQDRAKQQVSQAAKDVQVAEKRLQGLSNLLDSEKHKVDDQAGKIT